MRGFAVMLAGCGRLYFTPLEQVIPDSTHDSSPRDCWPAWRDQTIAFEAPRRVDGISLGMGPTNPSLGPGGLTLYFNLGDATATDVYRASRASRMEPWGDPQPVTELNSPAREHRLDVTADGTVAVLSSLRSGASKLYQSTRVDPSGMFSVPDPVPLASPNSGMLLFDPELRADGLRIYYSAHVTSEPNRIWVATRAVIGASFGSRVVLAELDVIVGASDPALAPDERVIVFAGGVATSAIYAATRDDTTSAFGTPWMVAALDVPGVFDEDVDVSTDGCEVVFVSLRDGPSAIYTAFAR